MSGKTIHGESNSLNHRATAEHRAWNGMLGRCRNRNDRNWWDYGGRGITVCERWHDFVNFLADMGRRPSTKHSLDRINNDGNYKPGNVRWATPEEQQRNKRTTVRHAVHGEMLTAAEIGERFGISLKVVRLRLSRGWSIDRVITPQQRWGAKSTQKLSASDVIDIRAARAGGSRPVDIARAFNISATHVTRIVRRSQRWRHVI